MSLDLSTLRSRFPALSTRDEDVSRIYLDNPGGTQVPDSVVERMAGYLMESNANLGGAFRTSRASEAVVAEAREAMAGNLCRCADYNKILNVAERAVELSRRS